MNMPKRFREPLSDLEFMFRAIGILIVVAVIVYFVFIRLSSSIK